MRICLAKWELVRNWTKFRSEMRILGRRLQCQTGDMWTASPFGRSGVMNWPRLLSSGGGG